MVRVLVDTGPLVAIVSRRDQYHQVCVEQLRAISPPLLSCWPVITEAAWLLRREPSAIQHLLQSAEMGFIQLLSLEVEAVGWMAKFLRRYRKLGAQVADGCLVYLAERENIDTVFTLDRRDFSVYRFQRNRSFRLLPA
jgi:predicted nucleic acid-binding protein